MRLAPVLSVVVPVYNESKVIRLQYEVLSKTLTELGVEYEIVYVNDGSTDDTWSQLLELEASDSRLCLVNLSRNFGHQVAITAGADQARGEAIVVMDADLQDPPEVLPEMVAKWREGYDVVYGIRSSREGETLFKRATAAIFYRMLNRLVPIDIPSDVGDFRLMSRRAVDALHAMPERNRYVRGMVAWVGFRQTGVHFARAPRRAGQTKYPLGKMARFAIDGLLSFSPGPLRLATVLALIMGALCVVYVAFAVYYKLALDRNVPGWTSTIVVVTLIGAMQLFCIGIVGEYIARIYDEVKRRPLYLIEELRRREAPGSQAVAEPASGAPPVPAPATIPEPSSSLHGDEEGHSTSEA